MDVKTKLVMVFKTSSDKQVSFSIEDPKDSLTEQGIKSAMELIVSQNIFAPNGSTLASAVGAKIVKTDTTDYDLVI